MNKILTLIVMLMCVGCTTAPTTGDDIVTFTLRSPVNKDVPDKAVVYMTPGATVVEVWSPFGIGNGKLTKEPDAEWPEKLIVRLHLRGLEGFDAKADGDESNRFHYFMKREEVSKRLKETGELKPIDVTIPSSLLKSSSEIVTIHWVDFYR